MATAAEYQKWLADHAGEAGTPDYETVARVAKDMGVVGNTALAPAATSDGDGSAVNFVTGRLNRGLANLAGAPVDIVHGVTNWASKNLSPAGRDMLPPNPVGGSQWIEELMRKGGMMPPEKDIQAESTGGKYLGAGLEALPSALVGRPTMNMLPRAATGAFTSGIGAQAGRDVAEGTGFEEAASIAGSALPGGKRVLSTPSAGEAAAAAQRAERYSQAKEMGIPVPPRAMRRDPVQEKIQKTATDDLGMAEGTALTPRNFDGYRNDQFQTGYLPVANAFPSGHMGSSPEFRNSVNQIGQEIFSQRTAFPRSTTRLAPQEDLLRDLGQRSFDVSETLHKIQQLRGSARTNMNAPSATDDTMRLGRTQQAAADALEGLVEQQATARGQGNLVDGMRAARTQMAKSYDIQEAIDPRTGNLDPGRLAALSAGGNTSGGVRNLSEVSQAFPEAMRTSGPEGLLTQRMSAHSAVHSPKSVVAHLLSKIVDPVARSRIYQELFVNPGNRMLPDRERVMRALIGMDSNDNSQE